MSKDGPEVIVLAGPNGAGKSTSAARLLRGALGVDEFVNADVIAQGLSAFAPERVALAAGRIMMRRLKELAAAGRVSRSRRPWPVARLPLGSLNSRPVVITST
jgi:predicted ABC-type ATPase